MIKPYYELPKCNLNDFSNDENWKDMTQLITAYQNCLLMVTEISSKRIEAEASQLKLW